MSRVASLTAPLVAAWIAGCANDPTPGRPDTLEAGADLSEGPYAQNHGVVFRDTDGSAKDVLQIFADHGYTWVRVRVNVDPPDAPRYAMFTDVDYAARLGLAAKSLGLKLLVDLHYSHWWADPANQWTPEAWQTHDPSRLADTVRGWTTATLTQLVASGAAPDAVQVGNEIHNGLLWDLGGPYRPGGSVDNLARLVGAGVDGVRAVVPDTQVVLHFETGGDRAKTLAWIEAFEAAGGPWDEVDVLGLSYYPMWQGGLPNLTDTLDGFAEAYPELELWVVETAYYWSPPEADYGDVDWPSAHTPTGQAGFLSRLREALLDRPAVTGVFYWGAAWAQSERWLDAPGWNDDDPSRRSLFDDSAVATEGIDALVGR